MFVRILTPNKVHKSTPDKLQTNSNPTKFSFPIVKYNLLYVVLIILHPALIFPPPETSARLDSHAHRRRVVL